MLVLDSEQVQRQERVTRFREQQHRNREDLLATIERKSITVANDGELATTDLLQQVGTPLHYKEVVRRILLMNPSLWYEDTHNSDEFGGIYYWQWVRLPEGSLTREKRQASGLQRIIMPERSVRHMKVEQMPNPDPFNKGTFIDVPVFTKETRGWRTVLARLLRARLITPSQIQQHFPVNDGKSRNWQMLTN